MIKFRGLLGYKCFNCKRKKRYKIDEMPLRHRDSFLIREAESDHAMTTNDNDPCNKLLLTIIIVDVLKYD